MKKLRIQIRMGTAGIIVDNKSFYVKTLFEASELLAERIREFGSTGANMLSMDVEFLPEWAWSKNEPEE